MKNLRFYLITLLLICTLIVSCKTTKQHVLQEWMRPNGKLKVLCTTRQIADLVMQVGDDLVDCLTLIPPESDPHSYQLVKGDDEKFARADLIFYNGLGLEHGPSLRAALTTNPKAYAVGDYVRKVRPEAIVLVDSTQDPHIWMDVSLWQETVPYIFEVLAKALPARKMQLEGRAATVSSRLQALDAEIIARMNSVPISARYLVTTHDAFNYFTRAYLSPKNELETDLWRVRCQAPEGLAPDSQLSTADIQRLVSHLERYRVQVIFSESHISQDSIKKIVDAMEKKGQPVHIASKPLFSDTMGHPDTGASDYISMMRYNSQVISEEMRENAHD